MPVTVWTLHLTHFHNGIQLTPHLTQPCVSLKEHTAAGPKATYWSTLCLIWDSTNQTAPITQIKVILSYLAETRWLRAATWSRRSRVVSFNITTALWAKSESAPLVRVTHAASSPSEQRVEGPPQLRRGEREGDDWVTWDLGKEQRKKRPQARRSISKQTTAPVYTPSHCWATSNWPRKRKLENIQRLTALF